MPHDATCHPFADIGIDLPATSTVCVFLELISLSTRFHYIIIARTREVFGFLKNALTARDGSKEIKWNFVKCKCYLYFLLILEFQIEITRTHEVGNYIFRKMNCENDVSCFFILLQLYLKLFRASV